MATLEQGKLSGFARYCAERQGKDVDYKGRRNVYLLVSPTFGKKMLLRRAIGRAEYRHAEQVLIEGVVFAALARNWQAGRTGGFEGWKSLDQIIKIMSRELPVFAKLLTASKVYEANSQHYSELSREFHALNNAADALEAPGTQHTAEMAAVIRIAIAEVHAELVNSADTLAFIKKQIGYLEAENDTDPA